MYYDPCSPLYHGTISLYADIIVKHGIQIYRRGKGGTDFGSGFYVTTQFNQAREWAMRRKERPIPIPHALEKEGITIRDFLGMKKDFQPVVLKIKIKNANNWLNLKHRIFDQENEQWQHFVWRMRQVNHSFSSCDYDWIYGLVADGGLQSADYKSIRAYKDKDQLAVLTNTAIQLLNISEVITCL
ncbi:DUF3990 domain-containing protein [Anoxybacteroides amylolyticum]|uniref:DUF3990 domain-containing protein n=1 Tax=Anoxybacteroides amylolyticum TaxID=294699 RepID=A0A160F2W4_9BACL|nr:DUF3990 domain-containing protein [Anoxybacillus amylolyticus]ANB59863.1 hypothetical protein GFC30_861 [Anoxybacillus amylolyticus]